MKIKKILIILTAAMCFMMAGCGKAADKVAEPVYIPAVFLIDSDTGLAENKDFVERFNEAYAGKYVLQAEWMNGNAGGLS